MIEARNVVILATMSRHDGEVMPSSRHATSVVLRRVRPSLRRGRVIDARKIVMLAI